MREQSAATIMDFDRTTETRLGDRLRPQDPRNERESASAPIDWHEPEVLRRVLIEAGLDVLDRDGPGYHVSGLTYAQVFAHLEREYGIRVTRGSVHQRIWPNQDAFRLEALIAYNEHLQASRNMSLGRLLSLVEEFETHDPEVADPFEFLDRMAVTHRDYADGRGFAPTLVIRALALAGTPGERAALSNMEQLRSPSGIERMAWLFRRLLRATNHRPRASHGLGDDASTVMAVLATSATTGLMLNAAIGMPDLWKGRTVIDRHGNLRDHSLYSIALRAYFELLFEPSPPGYRYPTGDRPPWPEHNPDRPDRPIDPATFPPDARRSRAELKQLILGAAVELFERDGLSLTASNIAYRKVFDRVEEKHGVVVNRSSVHRRLWDSNDAFRSDVLDAALNALPSAGFADGLRDTPVHIDDQGMVDTRRLTCDAVRNAVHAWHARPDNRMAMARSNRLKAALLDPEPDRRLQELQRNLVRQQEIVLLVYRSIYDEPMRNLALEVNPELCFSWDEAFQVHAAGVFATVTGLSFDHESGLEPPGRRYEMSMVENGPKTEWSTMAIGALAFSDLLFRFEKRPAAELGLAVDEQVGTEIAG